MPALFLASALNLTDDDQTQGCIALTLRLNLSQILLSETTTGRNAIDSLLRPLPAQA